MKERSAFTIVGGLLVLLMVGCNTHREVITYGVNTHSWNLSLHATSTRGSCDSTVDSCLRTVDEILTTQHTSKFYLNLVGDGQRIANEVTEYSLKSNAHPKLNEIGIDDFYANFRDWCKAYGKAKCKQQLADILNGVKSHNPRLGFGITLYDDELNSIVNDPQMPAPLRAQVDTVHFYLQYRENERKLATYVAAIERGFPNAKVILGMYPYDRVDYMPCAQGSTVHCTPASDKTWFVSALRAALQMENTGQVSAIEFYPGNFGSEAMWWGWRNRQVCSPRRRSQCIQDTESMHKSTAALIAASR